MGDIHDGELKAWAREAGCDARKLPCEVGQDGEHVAHTTRTVPRNAPITRVTDLWPVTTDERKLTAEQFVDKARKAHEVGP